MHSLQVQAALLGALVGRGPRARRRRQRRWGVFGGRRGGQGHSRHSPDRGSRGLIGRVQAQPREGGAAAAVTSRAFARAQVRFCAPAPSLRACQAHRALSGTAKLLAVTRLVASQSPATKRRPRRCAVACSQPGCLQVAAGSQPGQKNWACKPQAGAKSCKIDGPPRQWELTTLFSLNRSAPPSAGWSTHWSVWAPTVTAKRPAYVLPQVDTAARAAGHCPKGGLRFSACSTTVGGRSLPSKSVTQLLLCCLLLP